MHTARVLAVITAAAITLCSALPGQEPVPVGDQVQVNTYTTDVQRDPAVAVAPSGKVLVVWETRFGPIRARVHGVDGSPQGEDFEVSVNPADYLGDPAVAAGAGGDFVVVWGSGTAQGPYFDYDIRLRRISSDGSPAGAEWLVNSHTTGSQEDPDVARASNGEFVVVWSSTSALAYDPEWDVKLRRVSSDGSPIGGELLVNSYTTGDQWGPSVARAQNGEFVVAWTSEVPGSVYDSDVKLRRFSSNGSPIGGELAINSYTTGYQRDPSVASDPSGAFVVAWTSYGLVGDPEFGVHAQRYDSAGTAQGGLFQVNSYTTNSQEDPRVARSADGAFAVAWRSWGQDGDSGGIVARRYASDGSPQGGELLVNTYTTDRQADPAVGATPDGGFVVVWESAGSPEDDDLWDSIQARRYVPGNSIFADGFESGTTGAWSDTVPAPP